MAYFCMYGQGGRVDVVDGETVLRASFAWHMHEPPVTQAFAAGEEDAEAPTATPEEAGGDSSDGHQDSDGGSWDVGSANASDVPTEPEEDGREDVGGGGALARQAAGEGRLELGLSVAEMRQLVEVGRLVAGIVRWHNGPRGRRAQWWRLLVRRCRTPLVVLEVVAVVCSIGMLVNLVSLHQHFLLRADCLPAAAVLSHRPDVLEVRVKDD